jgi:hypothetical protein
VKGLPVLVLAAALAGAAIGGGAGVLGGYIYDRHEKSGAGHKFKLGAARSPQLP